MAQREYTNYREQAIYTFAAVTQKVWPKSLRAPIAPGARANCICPGCCHNFGYLVLAFIFAALYFKTILTPSGSPTLMFSVRN